MVAVDDISETWSRTREALKGKQKWWQMFCDVAAAAAAINWTLTSCSLVHCVCCPSARTRFFFSFSLLFLRSQRKKRRKGEKNTHNSLSLSLPLLLLLLFKQSPSSLSFELKRSLLFLQKDATDYMFIYISNKSIKWTRTIKDNRLISITERETNTSVSFSLSLYRDRHIYLPLSWTDVYIYPYSRPNRRKGKKKK